MLQTSVAGISAIFANSRSVASDARAALGVDPEVIENAVDLDEFAPAGAALDLDRLSGLPSEPELVRVGLVGTFARWKGHEIFLRALAELPCGQRVRGYVIGDAIYSTAGSQWTANDLRTRAAVLGVDGRVGFTGFQPAPPALRALDIVVHPATAPEPFGMSLAEAMACGRAVITTALGGAHDIIESDRTAVVVPAGDADALADAIGRLAESSAMRQRLGASARRAAAARFNRPRFVDQMIAAYERALASTSVRGRTVA
jgi:glycosyltransferase involved in cell wall biosynthesis